MTGIVRADCWRVALKMSIAGAGLYVNTWHALAPTLSSPADVASDCAKAYTDTDSFRHQQIADLSYDEITVQPLDGVTAGTTFTGAIFSHPFGAKSLSLLSPQCSVICSEKSLVSGQRGRGRLFLPGAPQTDRATSNTLWSGSAITDWQSAAANFLAMMQSGVATTGLGLPDSNTGPGPITVTSVVVRSGIGSQRRRAEQYF